MSHRSKPLLVDSSGVLSDYRGVLWTWLRIAQSPNFPHWNDNVEDKPPFFPECVAKGSRLWSGGPGAGPLFASSVSSGRHRVVNSVSLGEAAKPLLFEGFQAGCHVVLRGRRGTLWHSNLFDNVPKVSKLEEVLHEMLVFCCAHVSRLKSLVFLWRRRVYGGSCKTSPFRRFPSRLSCRFAWQAWHFVTFQPVW